MTATLTAPPGARVAPGGRRHRGPGLAAKLLPLLPAVVLLLLFFAGPVIWSVYTAFTDQSLSGAGASNAQFVGLANFTRMVADPAFWHSIVLTVRLRRRLGGDRAEHPRPAHRPAPAPPAPRHAGGGRRSWSSAPG